MHARQLVLGVDPGQPPVEKEAGNTRFVVFHRMERCGWVVKDDVNEDEVGEFEGIGVAAIDVVDDNLDDSLEVLTRRKDVDQSRLRI